MPQGGAHALEDALKVGALEGEEVVQRLEPRLLGLRAHTHQAQAQAQGESALKYARPGMERTLARGHAVTPGGAPHRSARTQPGSWARAPPGRPNSCDFPPPIRASGRGGRWGRGRGEASHLGDDRNYAADRGGGGREGERKRTWATIMRRTVAMRSSEAKNMCSVRQRPMPSAPNLRACARPNGQRASKAERVEASERNGRPHPGLRSAALLTRSGPPASSLPRHPTPSSRRLLSAGLVKAPSQTALQAAAQGSSRPRQGATDAPRQSRVRVHACKRPLLSSPLTSAASSGVSALVSTRSTRRSSTHAMKVPRSPASSGGASGCLPRMISPAQHGARTRTRAHALNHNTSCRAARALPSLREDAGVGSARGGRRGASGRWRRRWRRTCSPETAAPESEARRAHPATVIFAARGGSGTLRQRVRSSARAPVEPLSEMKSPSRISAPATRATLLCSSTCRVHASKGRPGEAITLAGRAGPKGKPALPPQCAPLAFGTPVAPAPPNAARGDGSWGVTSATAATAARSHWPLALNPRPSH